MVNPIPKSWFPQKILPLTYDDSLSYYEFLCRLMSKINEVISDTELRDMIKNIMDNIAETYSEEGSYEKDDYVWYDDKLYKCKGATSGVFDESKWELYRVSDYLLYILELIASKSNEDFWKTVEFIIPNYTSAQGANTSDIYYRKVDDTHIELGICLNGDAVDKSWNNTDVWEKETGSIENMTDYAGVILWKVYERIAYNREHAANAFKAAISVINSIARWYDESGTVTFKKYDLCYRIDDETMSVFYDHADMHDIHLYYANKTTTNGIEFSTDNWVEIVPSHSPNDAPSLRDWVKAMIDEYGGGGQPVYINRTQNVRNEILSSAEEGE